MICLIFNGNLVFLTKNSQFLIFLSAYNNLALRMKLEIIDPIVNTLLPTLQDSRLAGFTDAEGCFTLSLLSNSKGYRLRFIISQKWEVNKIILQHISTIFSVGNVSPHSVAAIVLLYIAVMSFDIGIISGLFISSMLPVAPDNDRPSRRLSKAEKSRITLSDKLKEILVGLILGGLTCQKQKLQRNPTFKFTQGMNHKEYLFHLYELFQNYCSKAPKKCNILPDKRTGKIYTYIVFYTYSLPCLVPFDELFFVEGNPVQKVVPLNIDKLLTPLGLCYWICEGGSFCKRDRAIILSTQGFSLQEVELLVKVLTDKFNLKCSIIKNGKAFGIRISTKSIPVIQSLLKEIMPPMMLHKIGL